MRIFGFDNSGAIHAGLVFLHDSAAVKLPFVALLSLAAAWSLSTPLRAQSYLVLHLDPAQWKDPPTYLYARNPGARPSRLFEHYKLDGHISLLTVSPGDHDLLHVDFSRYPETFSTISRSARRDSRTLFFNPTWEVRIEPKTLHYIGPGAFAPAELTREYAERILDLLCTTFPDEVSRVHTFRSLHYQQASVPLPYTCTVEGAEEP